MTTHNAVTSPGGAWPLGPANRWPEAIREIMKNAELLVEVADVPIDQLTFKITFDEWRSLVNHWDWYERSYNPLQWNMQRRIEDAYIATSRGALKLHCEVTYE